MGAGYSLYTYCLPPMRCKLFVFLGYRGSHAPLGACCFLIPAKSSEIFRPAVLRSRRPPIHALAGLPDGAGLTSHAFSLFFLSFS